MALRNRLMEALNRNLLKFIPGLHVHKFLLLVLALAIHLPKEALGCIGKYLGCLDGVEIPPLT